MVKKGSLQFDVGERENHPSLKGLTSILEALDESFGSNEDIVSVFSCTG